MPDNTVHGALREGREVSIENVDWGPGRVVVRVTNTGSASGAAKAAAAWWAEYSSTGIWVAKSYRAKAIDPEGMVYDVEIELRPAGDDLTDPTSVNYRGFEGSLQEVQTEKDLLGLDIYVEHTFPPDDKDYPGETVQQGGQVGISLPTHIITRNREIHTYYPEWYLFLKGRTNATRWFGYNPGYVRLSDVKSLKCVKLPNRPPKWTLQFTFECSQWPWAESIVFIDPRTSRPPVGLVEGVGKKTPYTYWAYDFNSIIDTSSMPYWADIISGEELQGEL